MQWLRARVEVVQGGTLYGEKEENRKKAITVMCIKMSSVEPPIERQSSNLKVFPNWFRNISSQILVLNLVTIHNILWLNFRFLNFRPAAPALRRSECAQKTSWSCYGWLNTQSVPFLPLPHGFDYPEKQWEKARETERERRVEGQTEWLNRVLHQAQVCLCFFFFVFFILSLPPFVKNDKYAEIYFSNADGGCVT